MVSQGVVNIIEQTRFMRTEVVGTELIQDLSQLWTFFNESVRVVARKYIRIHH